MGPTQGTFSSYSTSVGGELLPAAPLLFSPVLEPHQGGDIYSLAGLTWPEVIFQQHCPPRSTGMGHPSEWRHVPRPTIRWVSSGRWVLSEPCQYIHCPLLPITLSHVFSAPHNITRIQLTEKVPRPPGNGFSLYTINSLVILTGNLQNRIFCHPSYVTHCDFCNGKISTWPGRDKFTMFARHEDIGDSHTCIASFRTKRMIVEFRVDHIKGRYIWVSKILWNDWNPLPFYVFFRDRSRTWGAGDLNKASTK